MIPNYEVVDIKDVTVVDANTSYVMLSIKGGTVESWVRRSKIKGGWQLKKNEFIETLNMKKITAQNKGLCQ